METGTTSNHQNKKPIKQVILDYLKFNFNKKNNLIRLLFVCIAGVIVIAPSLGMNL